MLGTELAEETICRTKPHAGLRRASETLRCVFKAAHAEHADDDAIFSHANCHWRSQCLVSYGTCGERGNMRRKRARAAWRIRTPLSSWCSLSHLRVERAEGEDRTRKATLGPLGFLHPPPPPSKGRGGEKAVPSAPFASSASRRIWRTFDRKFAGKRGRDGGASTCSTYLRALCL